MCATCVSGHPCYENTRPIGCRNAVALEGVKAMFHLGSIVGAVVLSILSRPTDGIRIPLQLPWLASVAIYCFCFSFTAVRGAASARSG